MTRLFFFFFRGGGEFGDAVLCLREQTIGKQAGTKPLSHFVPLSSIVIANSVIVRYHHHHHRLQTTTFPITPMAVKKSPVYEEARMHFSSSSGSCIVSFFPSSLLAKFPQERKPALMERRGGISKERSKLRLEKALSWLSLANG